MYECEKEHESQSQISGCFNPEGGKSPSPAPKGAGRGSSQFPVLYYNHIPSSPFKLLYQSSPFKVGKHEANLSFGVL